MRPFIFIAACFFGARVFRARLRRWALLSYYYWLGISHRANISGIGGIVTGHERGRQTSESRPLRAGFDLIASSCLLHSSGTGRVAAGTRSPYLIYHSIVAARRPSSRRIRLNIQLPERSLLPRRFVPFASARSITTS